MQTDDHEAGSTLSVEETEKRTLAALLRTPPDPKAAKKQGEPTKRRGRPPKDRTGANSP
jgi:hypothetical protein